MANIQGGCHHQKADSKPPQDSWEEHLYLSVGEELWENLLDSKKYIQLYENVMRWNDSAVEEAFEAAKNLFLAKIKGVPCDVPLPDPDDNIDEVDWSDSGNAAELVFDEEETGQVRSDGEVVIVGFDEALMDPSFCVGWGPGPWDKEDPKKATAAAEWGGEQVVHVTIKTLYPEIWRWLLCERSMGAEEHREKMVVMKTYPS